jgi:hypothetical protein
MQTSKIFFSLFVLTILLSCNSPYDQMIKGLSGQRFCLEKAENEYDSTIKIGNGVLTLNADQTFTITNDSLQYSNLKGSWDLCCRGSDFGNYVFKVDGLKEWQQGSPNLFVLVNGKKVRMFFTTCK